MTALAYNNPRVQQLRRLIGRRSSRHEEGRFVVEGRVLVAEAIAAGWIVEAQFVAEESDASLPSSGAVIELAPGVFERVASTETPQPPIAIVKMVDRDVAATLATAGLVMVLDRIADPGNLGMIIQLLVLIPIVSIASICSETRILPISLVILLPTTPARTIHTSVGENSSKTASLTICAMAAWGIKGLTN